MSRFAASLSVLAVLLFWLFVVVMIVAVIVFVLVGLGPIIDVTADGGCSWSPTCERYLLFPLITH